MSCSHCTKRDDDIKFVVLKTAIGFRHISPGNAPPQTASWNCSNGASLREMRYEASHKIGSFMHKHTGVVSLEPHEQFQLMGTKIAQAVGSVFHHQLQLAAVVFGGVSR